MICPRCGYENKPTNLMCNLCGEILQRGAKGGTGPVPPSAQRGTPPPPFVPAPAAPTSWDENYCLFCFPLEPYPLDRDRQTTIGRSKENDLILPVEMVSRNHAILRWDVDAFVIKDLGSSNGTLVNDQPIKGERRLKDGDSIKVGPYKLEYRAFRGTIENLRIKPRVPEVTRNIANPAMEKATMLAGKIGEMRLEEVIQLIDFNKRTGTLEIEALGKAGRMYFRGGQILHAEWPHLSGVGAVREMLSLLLGSYRFTLGEPECEETIKDSTGKVLLDALRKIDEGG